MFNLPSAPFFCPLPRFIPLHPPDSLCPIFLLLSFWAIFISSSSESFVFKFSLFLCFVPFFSSWSLVCLALLLDYFGWVFASFFPSQCHRFHALHPSTFSVCEARVCTYHTQVDWREGLWHWQIIERVQHVVQVIFLGERHKKKERKRHGTTAEVFFCKCGWRCNLNNCAGTEAAGDQRANLQQDPEPFKTSDWHMFHHRRWG